MKPIIAGCVRLEDFGVVHIGIETSHTPKLFSSPCRKSRFWCRIAGIQESHLLSLPM
jgi:hypothetical protein